jgi:putative aminopeptidase FrvX
VDAKLFKRLASTPGISGREERIREVVKEELAPWVDDLRVDRLGNVIGVRGSSGPKVMLCAHMDTIGFLVSHIDDDGFIRVQPVGGFDARTLVAQRVVVLGKKDYVGLLTPATKPIHILSDEESKRPPKIEDVIVDLMLPPDEVKANVSLGDPVSFHQEPIVTDHAVTAPYLDDRLGVYVLIEALRKAGSNGSQVYAVVSVQEEVGVRGAKTSAFEIEPDIGIALDVTIASDLPGIDKAQRVTTLGNGTAVGVMDSMTIADPRLVSRLTELAAAASVKHQLDILPFGGTDAGAIQLTRAGVPSITMAVPVRYVHTTAEMAFISDINATVDVVAHFLAVAHEMDLAW